MDDHCNTGATRWYGPDGRGVTIYSAEYETAQALLYTGD